MDIRYHVKEKLHENTNIDFYTPHLFGNVLSYTSKLSGGKECCSVKLLRHPIAALVLGADVLK